VDNIPSSAIVIVANALISIYGRTTGSDGRRRHAERVDSMPNRLIREALLDSGRYWSVTIEARQLFWHLMLLADDFGCVSLAPVFIRRRCFDDSPCTEKVNVLLGQLADADLCERRREFRLKLAALKSIDKKPIARQRESPLDLVFHAVALAFYEHGLRVMEKTIEQR
jgi:hypothetical protein